MFDASNNYSLKLTDRASHKIFDKFFFRIKNAFTTYKG